MKSVIVYIAGLLLFLASLFAPAFSPYGALDYSGWDALHALLTLRPRLLLDSGRSGDVLAAAVIVLTGLNNLVAAISPLLFPLRRRLNRNRWFWTGAGLLLGCAAATLIGTWHGGFIRLRYGYYLWLLSLGLIYSAFLPSPPARPGDGTP